LSDTGAPSELELTDLEAIDAMIHSADQASETADEKLARLRAALSDQRPTLVFTGRRATVRYLRNHLDSNAVAWCTGDRAGIGRVALPRSSVWRRFGAEASSRDSPRVLIATDVAAEGLDLPRVERVVHYDLPYTPMRLEQREGRAVRLGSVHATIDVLRFLPALPFERRLRRTAALRHKAKLPGSAGIGPAGRDLWRWRAELAERYEEGPRVNGVASVTADVTGILAGFMIGERATALLWFDSATGTWTDESVTVQTRLHTAASSTALRTVSAKALREALCVLADPVRQRLAIAAGSRWSMPEPDTAARALAARLQPCVAAAARRRDAAGLRQLERILHFLAGGRTAGERMAIERVTAVPSGDWLRKALCLPVRERTAVSFDVQLVGLVLFEPR